MTTRQSRHFREVIRLIQLYPFTFQPVYQERLWGGTGLRKYRPDVPGDRIGESWEISAHEHGASLVANGPLRGESLDRLVAQFPEELLGSQEAQFPLLLKLISSRDTLSVQVHPQDHYAQIHEEGSLGKHELWYVLDAEPGAWIVYGLKPEVTSFEFRQAIAGGRVPETLRKVSVKPGDVFDIPPGLVHALGPGVTLAEIQQSSDVTYRVYDWDRVDANGKPRELHIEKALDVIDFGLRPKLDSPGLGYGLPGGRVQIRGANPYFAVEELTCEGQISWTEPVRRFVLYFLLEGNLELMWSAGQLPVDRGATILVPAAVNEYTFGGKGKLLRFYVPDLKQDVLSPLQAEGFNREEILSAIAGLDASML